MMSVIGRKNAGKTTLLIALAAELVRRKFRVMTIKHATHPADTDQRGKDSWRHWHEGHAERVLMEGPGQRVLWERTGQESDPIALARPHPRGAGIVLVGGVKAGRPGPPPRGGSVYRPGRGLQGRSAAEDRAVPSRGGAQPAIRPGRPRPGR